MAKKTQLTSWASPPKLFSNVLVASASCWVGRGDVEFSLVWKERGEKSFVSEIKYKAEISKQKIKTKSKPFPISNLKNKKPTSNKNKEHCTI